MRFPHEPAFTVESLAMIATDRLMEPFLTGTETFFHGYTFGGHPVSTAVAMANSSNGPRSIFRAPTTGRRGCSGRAARTNWTIEDLAAGIIGRNRIHITTHRLASRIHARDDGELRIRGKHHHQQHQNSLRNNRSVMRSCHNRDHEKDQSAEQSYPMQTHQRAADDHTGGVNACRRSSEERRKLAEGDGGEYGAKEKQRAQPKAKHQVHQRMEECAHLATWEPGR